MKRQLIAILYADVAGYSRLTGLDEDVTHKKLNVGLDLLSDKIAAYSGQKIHEAGDAILAEFPSVTDAVTTATDFQHEMQLKNSGLSKEARLEFRVGINIGEVIHDRNDIFGDGVNLAARIQDLAEPGGVCISGAVYDQLRGQTGHTFVDLGYRKLKNIAESVHVYALRDPGIPATESSGMFFDKLVLAAA